jgi:hypothetical protein
VSRQILQFATTRIGHTGALGQVAVNSDITVRATADSVIPA